MKLVPYGDRGVLLAELSDALRADLMVRLQLKLPLGCDEFVVGYDSILLIGRDIQGLDSLERNLESAAIAGRNMPAQRVRCHDIIVHYDGEDLATVAKACRMSVDRVIELHHAPTYTVRMMGFSPGFPYLDGLDPRLNLERRALPRKHIAPGTVAIGGSHAGIYSVASPGGWHLLGRTQTPLFDLAAAQSPNPTASEVFLCAPGDQVRFHPYQAND
jgi:KipI family sensor histidine kinase inhibitor